MLLKFIENLKPAFNQLPGEKAHNELIPASRKMFKIDQSELRESSVIITLFEQEGQIKFILTKRHAYGGHHSGQMCIPGGKKEDNERIVDTAIRENYEEIGVQLPEQNIIGKLSQITIPVSNFSIDPFVGYMVNMPVLNPDPVEVESTHIVPISELLNAPIQESSEIMANQDFMIPYFELQGQIVWGATAMILSEFRALLKG